MFQRRESWTATYNNPDHGDPHRTASPEAITIKEVQYTTRQTPQVVNAHHEAKEIIIGVVDGIEEVDIALNSPEQTLIITCFQISSLPCATISRGDIPKKINDISQVNVIASRRGRPLPKTFNFIVVIEVALAQSECQKQ